MTFLFSVLVAALPANIFRRSVPFHNPRAGAELLALVCGCSLVIAFAMQVQALGGATLVPTLPHWVANLPVRFPFGEPGTTPRVGPEVTDRVLVLAVLECVSLLGMTIGVAASRRSAAIITTVIGAGALASCAFIAPAADSPDAYLYVAHSLLGWRAYSPPAVPFGGEFSVLNKLWGLPVLPSAYGPLWNLSSALVLGSVSGLVGKLLALRVIGAFAVFLAAELTRRIGAPSSIVAAVACNPALYDLYVMGQHNDLVAVDCALGAMLAARRSATFTCALLVVTAGLFKATLGPIALVATVSIEKVQTRIALAVAAASGLAGIYLFGQHGEYWRALRFVNQHFAAGAEPPGSIPLHIVAIGVTLLTVIMTVARRRLQAAAAWAPMALGVYPLAWYLPWGLPIALGDQGVAYVFLVTMPLMAYLLEIFYFGTVPFDALRALVLFAAIGAVAMAYKPRKVSQRCGESNSRDVAP